MENHGFEAQMERIKMITGKRTQTELAELLGVKRSSVSDAKRRGKVPSGWLVVLMHDKHANPEWILTGNGPALVSFPARRCATSDEDTEHRADEEALRRLPSRILADELARRAMPGQS